MRASALKNAIELAKNGEGPISEIVAKSQEVGVIVPSILRKNLKDAGYQVTYHEGPGENAKEGEHEHGAWVLVRLNGDIVARAYSHDEDDALLQAMYGALKEESQIKEEEGLVTV